MLRDVAGQSIWVAEQGADQNVADTRLFIHCSLARHETLLPLAGALPAARNIFFDLPGHGRSADWEGADFQTDILRIAGGLLNGPAHIIGHSFGATVALRMAVERPDLVSRLTLIEPVMFAAARDSTAHAAHQIAMEPFTSAWRAGDRASATREFLNMWGNGPAWDDIPQNKQNALAAQIHMIPTTSPAIENDVHGILDRLPDINCPVDLIEGAGSQPIMSAIMVGLADKIPHARRHIIDGAGHMVPITHAAIVASAL